jgi:hypothetical protein
VVNQINQMGPIQYQVDITQSHIYLINEVTVIDLGAFGLQGDSQISELIASKFDDLTTGGTTVLSLDGTGITNLIIPTNVNRVWNVVASWVAVVIGTSGTTTGVNT